MSQNNSILFITSFRNIGRDNWTAFRRDVTEYVQRFHTMVENMRYPIVAYVDSKTMPLINSYKNVTVVDSASVGTFFEKYEATEQAIIDSDAYKNMIPSKRKNHPEHRYASYNLINHSKINYIKDAMEKYPEYTHYAWIDFGCVTDLSIIPCNMDLSKLDPSRVMNHYLILPSQPGRSPQEMLTTFDIYVMGSMFVLPKSLIVTYEQMYESELMHWHSIGVSDDDQSLVYQLMLKHPDMFLSLPSDGLWHVLFKKHLNRPLVLPVLSENVSGELFEAMQKYGSIRTERVCKLYESLLKNKREQVQNIFELGVGSLNSSLLCYGGAPGGCLRAWRQFCPSARIIGADIDRESLIREDRIETLYCNKLSGTHQLASIEKVVFDVMIDSAGGSFDSSVRFMETVINRLSRQGIYAIEGIRDEDLVSCQNRKAELGSRYPYNFIVQGDVMIALPRV
jgi:hypothetical protein